jgi:hypothetical protein
MSKNVWKYHKTPTLYNYYVPIMKEQKFEQILFFEQILYMTIDV